jgi:hypothetical protein
MLSVCQMFYWSRDLFSFRSSETSAVEPTAVMPIDPPSMYRERFEGYFNERRSVAPKFSTASRNTLLTPYHYGGGFGTEPKSNHNLSGTPVGPRAYTPPARHTPCATFGTARRLDVFGPKDSDTRNSGGVREMAPSSSRRRNNNNTESYRENFLDERTLRSRKRNEESQPGPQSYTTNRSDFDLSHPKAHDTRLLNAKFAQEGAHTPRPYIPGSKGGVIPRSSRRNLSQEAASMPGPADYHPRYGLVK